MTNDQIEAPAPTSRLTESEQMVLDLVGGLTPENLHSQFGLPMKRCEEIYAAYLKYLYS